MKSFMRKAAIAAVTLAGCAGTVAAADLYGGSYKDSGSMPIANYGPSWYVRLDAGWATFDEPELNEDGRWRLRQSKADDTWSIGGGVGHYFTRNVRGDVTFEWRDRTDFRGTLVDPAGPVPGERRFGVQSNVLLANLYYDFTPGHRISPYLGVGLGTVHHDVARGSVKAICGCDGTIDGASNWDVAAAFMTGVSIDLLGGRGGGHWSGGGGGLLDRALKLDLGYRFLYLGDTATGPVRRDTQRVSRDPEVTGIVAHELRVGLRYDLR